MQRREALGLVGGAAAAAFLTHATTAKAEDKPDGAATVCPLCADCMQECLKCYAHCAKLVAKGETHHARAMAHCLDCADFCNLCLSTSARNGPMKKLAAEACVKACEACAKACEGHDDAVMKACAEMCKKCAECCKSCAA